MVRNYTKTLLEKGEQRKRLTSKLQHMANEIAGCILESAKGIEVSVGDDVYTAEKVSSYASERYYLMINGRAITDEAKPGEKFYLDNDKDAEICVAKTEEFLRFINNLKAVIGKFEAEEEKVINGIKDAFEYLRKITN